MPTFHKPIPPGLQETPSPERSSDTMFRGRVSLAQHRKGYRFSVDAVLLSHFAAQLPPVETLDVGTGCGVVPLLLADLWSQIGHTPALTAIERQASLAALAQDNLLHNQRQDQITLHHDDIRTWSPGRQWRLITCNPPYRPPQDGRVSPNAERAAARHELHGSLEEMLHAMSLLLHPRGAVAFVYPVAHLPRLFGALAQAQLRPLRLRLVHPRTQAPARLALLLANRSAHALNVAPPLILYQSDLPRDYTPEADAIFAGNPPDLQHPSLER